MIVGEMLQSLEDDVLTQLLGAVRLRVQNHASEFLDDAWGQHVVQLIRKVPNAQNIAVSTDRPGVRPSEDPEYDDHGDPAGPSGDGPM